MENVVNSEYFKLAVVLKSVLGITHHEMKDIRKNISKYKKRKEIVQEINDYLNDDDDDLSDGLTDDEDDDDDDDETLDIDDENNDKLDKMTKWIGVGIIAVILIIAVFVL